MKESELKLFLSLLHELQRRSKNELSYTNAQLADLCGLSTGSLKSGRDLLTGRGLIIATRGRSGVYDYSVCMHAQEGAEAPAARFVARKKTLWELSRSENERYYRSRLGEKVRGATKDGFMALCAFHRDSKPSLSVDVVNGRWYCHACKEGGGTLKFEMMFSQITASEAIENIAKLTGVLGLVQNAKAQDPEALYDYADEYGELLSQLLRFPGKDFRWRRPVGEAWVSNLQGVRKVLYRLPEVLKASHVIVCEGEKDADNVAALNLVTSGGEKVAVTTNPGGAGKWKSEYTECLLGKRVAILPDMDEPGLAHADEIHEQIEDSRLVLLPVEVKDVSDYLKLHTANDLIQLIEADWFDMRQECSVIQGYQFVEA